MLCFLFCFVFLLNKRSQMSHKRSGVTGPAHASAAASSEASAASSSAAEADEITIPQRKGNKRGG